MGKVVRRQVELAGGSFSILEGGPRGAPCGPPDVIWLHAAGFHAAAYTPLLQSLADDVCIHAGDARGHGHTTAAKEPARLTSWRVYYDDLVAALDALPAGARVVLAGHSTGATTCVFAAAQRPARVSALVLVEPVFYLPIIGSKPRKRLMAGAQRRRSSFASPAEAYESFRKRAAFSSISDEWLHSYVDDAFVETESGSHVLRCTPEWEYQTYNTNERWPWFAIMRAKAPTTLLVAESGSSCPPSSRRILRLLKPSWSVRIVPGTSHLLPMEKPSEVIGSITGAVRSFTT